VIRKEQNFHLSSFKSGETKFDSKKKKIIVIIICDELVVILIILGEVS